MYELCEQGNTSRSGLTQLLELTSMGLVLAPITATAKLKSRPKNNTKRTLVLMTLAAKMRLCVNVEFVADMFRVAAFDVYVKSQMK
jgi:hypothetical protein